MYFVSQILLVCVVTVCIKSLECNEDAFPIYTLKKYCFTGLFVILNACSSARKQDMTSSADGRIKPQKYAIRSILCGKKVIVLPSRRILQFSLSKAHVNFIPYLNKDDKIVGSCLRIKFPTLQHELVFQNVDLYGC